MPTDFESLTCIRENQMQCSSLYDLVGNSQIPKLQLILIGHMWHSPSMYLELFLAALKSDPKHSRALLISSIGRFFTRNVSSPSITLVHCRPFLTYSPVSSTVFSLIR